MIHRGGRISPFITPGRFASANEELLPQWLSGKDPQAQQRLVETCAPLVYSVCRRFLHHPQDVEDAAQETFLKLTRHAGRIEGSLTAWLAATAYNSSVDLIRRAARERRRREELAKRPLVDPPYHVVHEHIAERLAQALLELDDPQRDLITERFVRKTPMRLLAGQHQVSVSAISRRVAAALHDLADVLVDMGVDTADDLTLAEHFGDPLRVEQLGVDPLRFASDWRAGELWNSARSTIPGWDRPIRVGVLISYRSTIAPGSNGPWPADIQLQTTRWMPHQGFQWVSVIEPDSAQRGPIECAMREYELVGGLIDATDAEALKTLDVILLGWNISMSIDVARALCEAVCSGVGLLNEYWTANCDKIRDCAEVQALMLAGSFIHAHHVIPHGSAAPGHFIREHALLPGITSGMAISAAGCGPLYKPADGATVLAIGDEIVAESKHHIPGLGDSSRPLCLTGHLGRGRVWVMNIFSHYRLAAHLTIPFDQYLGNVLSWLAEAQRERAILSG